VVPCTWSTSGVFYNGHCDEACNKRSAGCHSKDTIAASQAATLWGLFRERVRRCPDAIAYRDYDHTKRIWRDHSWRKISERVDRFRAVLALANINPGDRVATLLPNGTDWACLDIAAHALLTPTLKIKRELVAPLFAKEIDDLYAKR
jgi:acyl-CoA synthetase (AMP-forming)/AMP-acid ligase II